ncbi:MAG TPA: D-aminoacyl-tRNA deacylase [Candidatus Kapabacteria bacterium]|jgi:D-tyrosyl-tRNA(Tyr) deacylase
MRILLQRVSRASVRVNGEIVGEIAHGLTAFVGVHGSDTAETASWMAQKVVNCRIFEDEMGKMNRSLLETGGSVLVISQFTLYGELVKGTRPSFMAAAAPEHAEALYKSFLGELIEKIGIARVAAGVFRATMQVELVNEGPVTILLER